ncbi:MAG: glycoside hydrolase N-terminal domain-containing protein, partial [Eubacteriales bacterium]
MDNKYMIQMKYPSGWWQSRWREAVPLGNGITGASVYGGVWDETIMFTHTDLYWKSKNPEMPDVSHVLPEVREKLLNKEPFVADQIMPNELKKLGYNATLATPLPICDLKIKMETNKGFKKYQRNLDMKNGEAVVQWNDADMTMKRKCFVSYERNIFALEISENSALPFSCELSLDTHELEDAQWYGEKMEDFLPQDKISGVQNDSYLVYTAKNDDGTDFGAIAKIEIEDGTYSIEGNKLVVKHATNLKLVLKTYIKGERNSDIKKVQEELDDIGMDYHALFEEHQKQWTPLFLSAALDLGAEQYNTANEELLLDAYQGEASLEMLEKMWAYGRYLLLASSKEGGNPCNLYGLWCGEYMGMWSFNMANENLQMIYWQALTGNTPELLLPVFDYMERLMDDFKTNAKKMFGCRGIFVPAPTCPDSGLNKLNMAHITYWTGGAGWIGQHYYDYYLCTQDKEFLKNRAIPYLKEVALFYEDFCVIGEDGNYMTIPSNSPENSPGNFWDGKSGMGIVMETTMNATMDFAIAKEVLTNLIEGCEICNVELDQIEKWKMMLTKIPAYEINEDGAVKEWMHEYYKDNYRHRHQSHLYPLFPGNEIHVETEPEL